MLPVNSRNHYKVVAQECGDRLNRPTGWPCSDNCSMIAESLGWIGEPSFAFCFGDRASRRGDSVPLVSVMLRRFFPLNSLDRRPGFVVESDEAGFCGLCLRPSSWAAWSKLARFTPVSSLTLMR